MEIGDFVSGHEFDNPIKIRNFVSDVSDLVKHAAEIAVQKIDGDSRHFGIFAGQFMLFDKFC
jgi:hypothetical protein